MEETYFCHMCYCSVCVHINTQTKDDARYWKISDTDLIEILLVTELLLDKVMQSISDVMVCTLRQLLPCIHICVVSVNITHVNGIHM